MAAIVGLPRPCWVATAIVFLMGLCCMGLGIAMAKKQVQGEVEVRVDVGIALADTDEDFICATMDWWPPQKCDYNVCSWGHSTLLTLNLSSPLLAKAMKAFSPLKLRLGGSLEDQIVYDVGEHNEGCQPFVKNTSAMFGFSGGCLIMDRWDDLNALFQETGVSVVFSLNELRGKHVVPKNTTTGPWDYRNAEDFIKYTVSKGYKIKGWELGNELCGTGVGTRIEPDRYAADVKELWRIVDEAYKGSNEKPLVLAPGGNYDAGWFKDFLVQSGPNVVNAVTHHIYNLGAGVDSHLVEKILNPSFLTQISSTFRSLQEIVQQYGSWAKPWVGEAGGAYNSGHNLVSNAFVYGFWYLDQLGMSATYNTGSYCRQSLIGGNYGLLNTTTFAPNPDYYNALLWHRLMGKRVLSTQHDGSDYLRSYAHCSKNTKGITLVLLNYSNSTQILVSVHPQTANLEDMIREEYHLTSKDQNLHSQTMYLNGKALDLTEAGELPALIPLKIEASKPVSLAPLSFAFIHLPYVSHPSCG